MRERIANNTTLVLLAVGSLVPIWITRFLPLVDEPNHLSAVYIWHHLASPDSPLHQFYELRIELVSYFLHYFIAHEAAWVVGVEAGHKFALSVYVLGFSLAGLWWCERTERTPWLCVLLFALPYSHFWAFGFHPFNLGLTVLLLAVSIFDRLMETVTPGRLAAAAGVAVLCFLSHPIPLAMLFMVVPVLVLAAGLSVRRLVAAAAALLPAVGLLYRQALQSSVAGANWQKIAGGKLLRVDPREWRERLRIFDDFVMDVVVGDQDTRLFHALIACGAVLLLCGFSRRSPPCWVKRPTWLYPQRGLLLMLVMLVGYLILPTDFGEPVGILTVSGRFAPVACFFFLLAAPIRRGDWRRFLSLPGVLITVLALTNISIKYGRFAEHMRPLPGLVAKCGHEGNILTVSANPHWYLPTTDLAPFRLLPAWVQILHGGYAPDWWERPIPFPFRVKNPLPAPSWWDPEGYRRYLGEPYGCVITHRLTEKLPKDQWRLRGGTGDWRVYLRR